MDNWEKNKLWGPLAAGQLDLQVSVCVNETGLWFAQCVRVNWRVESVHNHQRGENWRQIFHSRRGSKLLVLDGEFALARDVTMIFISELTQRWTHTLTYTHTHTHAPELLQKTKTAFKGEKETFLVASNFNFTDQKAQTELLTHTLIHTKHTHTLHPLYVYIHTVVCPHLSDL